MKEFIFLLFFVSCGNSVFVVAQQHMVRLSGSIKSEKNEPLAFAAVRFVSKLNSSTVFGGSSNEKGVFSVVLPAGYYTIDISYVGYAKYVSFVEAIKDMNLPDIVLGTESQQIDEVVVMAKNITFKPNGYIANISNNPLYKKYDVNEILRLTPGTYSTEHGITVFGK